MARLHQVLAFAAVLVVSSAPSARRLPGVPHRMPGGRARSVDQGSAVGPGEVRGGHTMVVPEGRCPLCWQSLSMTRGGGVHDCVTYPVPWYASPLRRAKTLALMTLMLQNFALSMAMRYSRTRKVDHRYHPSEAVAMSEFFKMMISLALAAKAETLGPADASRSARGRWVAKVRGAVSTSYGEAGSYVLLVPAGWLHHVAANEPPAGEERGGLRAWPWASLNLFFDVRMRPRFPLFDACDGGAADASLAQAPPVHPPGERSYSQLRDSRASSALSICCPRSASSPAKDALLRG